MAHGFTKGQDIRTRDKGLEARVLEVYNQFDVRVRLTAVTGDYVDSARVGDVLYLTNPGELWEPYPNPVTVLVAMAITLDPQDWANKFGVKGMAQLRDSVQQYVLALVENEGVFSDATVSRRKP